MTREDEERIHRRSENCCSEKRVMILLVVLVSFIFFSKLYLACVYYYSTFATWLLLPSAIVALVFSIIFIYVSFPRSLLPDFFIFFFPFVIYFFLARVVLHCCFTVTYNLVVALLGNLLFSFFFYFCYSDGEVWWRADLRTPGVGGLDRTTTIQVGTV